MYRRSLPAEAHVDRVASHRDDDRRAEEYSPSTKRLAVAAAIVASSAEQRVTI
jgi:hypothetical protein